MAKQKKALSVEESVTSQNLAIRLLYVQQRIDALERLYNDEVADLKKDVTAIKVAVVRSAQAQGQFDEEMTGAPNPEQSEEDDV